MIEIKLYRSKWKAIRLLLLTSPFVILSLYDIVSHSEITPIYLSWFCLCFFGLGIPISLFNFFDRRPEIIIDKKGIFSRSSYSIFDKRSNRGFIEWPDIKEIYMLSYKNNWRGLPTSTQSFICMKLSHDAKIIEGKYKTPSTLSKSFGMGDFSIPLQLLKINKQDFFEFIKSMIAADTSTKDALILNTKL